MRSDPANNDRRVDTDNAETNAETNAEISASTSSAMEPHTEDDSGSLEDEVVWKGRLKGQTSPGAQPPVDLEEDHGKAILVFTMITTIFLPLSFVTSFFGMNMSDIRNTNSTQAFFWAIAIPVTAGIVFAAVLLAYRGDKLYDTVVQAMRELKEQWRRKKGTSGTFAKRKEVAGSLAICSAFLGSAQAE